MRKNIFLILCFTAILASCTSFEFSDDYANSKSDDTAYLQDLFDSDNSEIIIPANPTEKPWFTDRLYLKGIKDKTIIFEPGCVIMAKPGAFHDVNDCLITMVECKNLTLLGYGATLKMRKRDYQQANYTESQWRDIIDILASEKITIEGLKIASSGGDGIYIGVKDGKICKDITLRNLILEDNHRQGVSVIEVDGFLMEGCSVFGTDGHLPKAGIDFEPNNSYHGFTRCVIKNCSFTYNKGSGIHIFLRYAEPHKFPVDITIENCVSKHNAAAISIMQVKNGIEGKITIKNCDFKGIQFIKVPNSLLVTDR